LLAGAEIRTKKPHTGQRCWSSPLEAQNCGKDQDANRRSNDHCCAGRRVLRSACTQEQRAGGVIKGNISSSGERIYHVPGQRYYDKTLIHLSKGERWFCTEQEAVAAGWRKAKV
jgi:micrococcal nuclease